MIYLGISVPTYPSTSSSGKLGTQQSTSTAARLATLLFTTKLAPMANDASLRLVLFMMFWSYWGIGARKLRATGFANYEEFESVLRDIEIAILRYLAPSTLPFRMHCI